MWKPFGLQRSWDSCYHIITLSMINCRKREEGTRQKTIILCASCFLSFFDAESWKPQPHKINKPRHNHDKCGCTTNVYSMTYYSFVCGFVRAHARVSGRCFFQLWKQWVIRQFQKETKQKNVFRNIAVVARRRWLGIRLTSMSSNILCWYNLIKLIYYQVHYHLEIVKN